MKIKYKSVSNLKILQEKLSSFDLNTQIYYKDKYNFKIKKHR